MLTDAKITTMLPVTDVDRARRFYADLLGLREVAVTDDGTRIFEAGAGAIGLRKAEPGAQSPRTALSFLVADLEHEVHELTGQGVTFADHDDGAAWFTDTEGNLLCLNQTT
jgi:catechol 2,3-dioxygenase-like lactoylglutathione lyase family enzyme